jgi:hypothetical protein
MDVTTPSGGPKGMITGPKKLKHGCKKPGREGFKGSRYQDTIRRG